MAGAVSEPTYRRFLPGIGTLGLRPLELTDHGPLVHNWVTQPYARYWGLLNASVADVHTEYLRIEHSDHHQAFIGEHDGRPAFLLERYEPMHDAVGRTYDVAPGDIGMHVLVSPPVTPINRFTGAVFEVIMDKTFPNPLAANTPAQL